MAKTTGINVEGPKVDREAVESLSEAIERVLAAGHVNHHDQETVRTALDTLGSIGDMSASITGCHVAMSGPTPGRPGIIYGPQP